MAKSLFRSFFSTGIELSIASLIGMLLAPFVLHHVGQEHYGAWALVVAITSQFVLLDIGTLSALTAMLPSSQGDARRRLRSSALLILVVAATLGIVVTILLAGFSDSIFHLNPQTVPLFRILLIVAGVDTALAIVTFLFNGTLASRERYDLLSGTNIVRLLVNAVAIFLALRSGLGIVAVAVITASLRLLQRLALSYFAVKEDLPFSLGMPSSAEISKILSYGKWTFLVILSGRIIYQVDTIVIGIFIGAVAVTAYAIPLLLIDQFRVLAQAGSAILIPRLSALVASGDSGSRQEVQDIIFKWARIGSLLSIGVGIPIILYGDEFITLWMGSEFPLSHTILTILIIPFFLTIPTFGLTSYLFATKKHFLIAQIQGIEAAVNIALSVLLVKSFGIVGVAYGTLIPAVLFGGLLLPSIACRRAGVSFATFFSTAYSKPAIFGGIYFVVLFVIGRNIGALSWPSLILIHALGGIFFTYYTWYIYLSGEERAYIRRRILPKG